MVLGADSQPVGRAVRKLGDATRQGPGERHAPVLEPQVPVQVGGVVLLDDESPPRGCPASPPCGSGVRSKSRFRRYSLSRSAIATASPAEHV